MEEERKITLSVTKSELERLNELVANKNKVLNEKLNKDVYENDMSYDDAITDEMLDFTNIELEVLVPAMIKAEENENGTFMTDEDMEKSISSLKKIKPLEYMDQSSFNNMYPLNELLGSVFLVISEAISLWNNDLSLRNISILTDIPPEIVDAELDAHLNKLGLIKYYYIENPHIPGDGVKLKNLIGVKFGDELTNQNNDRIFRLVSPDQIEVHYRIRRNFLRQDYTE